MIHAEIICDSINTSGNRLTTFLVTYNRFVQAELLRHRSFSFCSASSRAIPVGKTLKYVWNSTAYPVEWGSNKAGMQAGEQIPRHKIWIARKIIKISCLFQIIVSWILFRLGLHKQICNRYTEPFIYITQIVQGTDFGNFFNLRAHKDAQPEIRELAFKMLECYATSKPRQLDWLEWHLPFGDIYDENLSLEEKIKVSVARCARLSYSSHDGNFSKEKDFQLYDRLLASKHFSPFEFPSQAMCGDERYGNLVGWRQYRKTLPSECQNELDIPKLLSSKGNL